MDLFTEGQKISLLFQKNTNMVEMICSIEKVYSDRLDLLLPQYFMRYIEFLQVNSKITAKAFSKLGTVDFNSVVIHSPLEDTFTIELDYNSIKLTPSEQIPCVSAVEKLEIKLEEESVIYKTFELSTEYIKFYSDKKFSIGDEYNCTLIFPKDYGTIDFKINISENDPVFTNEYTASFLSMEEAARQTLLYYMYMYSKDFD